MIKAGIKIRFFLWLVLSLVISWLFWQAIVPSGRISYTYNFKKNNYFITKLTPNTRVENPKNGKQKIIGNPVYFSLHTPRKFTKAYLTVKLRQSSKISVVEAGVLADKKIWRYNLQPLDNKIIDQLALTWHKIIQGNLILLQKEKKYKSINEFKTKLPPRDKFALYHYDLKNNFILSNYASSSHDYILPYALRGPYQFYTYIKNEKLDFVFTFLDLNKNKDKDEIDINVYYQNKLIANNHLDDDGIVNDSGKILPVRKLELKIPNLPEGAYKIELRANNDIVTQYIKTPQNKLAFIHKFWLISRHNKTKENNTKIIILFTDSRKFNAETTNPNSLQIIKFINGKKLNILKTYKLYSTNLTASNTKIILNKKDIIISGDGVFSFNRNSLLNPLFLKVSPWLNIKKNNINYILAKYNFPKKNDGWLTTRAVFDLKHVYRENKQYNFLISIPNLYANDDEINTWVEIKKIKIELIGQNLKDKIKFLILSFFHNF